MPGTQNVGTKKHSRYVPYEMFNLQAGVLEKSKSCLCMHKFTTAAPQNEKPCRFITASDCVFPLTSVRLHICARNKHYVTAPFTQQ